jgi:hypothetical protein
MDVQENKFSKHKSAQQTILTLWSGYLYIFEFFLLIGFLILVFLIFAHVLPKLQYCRQRMRDTADVTGG